MGPTDQLTANLDKLESQPVDSAKLSEVEVQSLLKLFWPDEKSKVDMDVSKLYDEAVQKIKAMKNEEILDLILHLDVVARTNKHEVAEAEKRLQEALDRAKERCEQSESNHNMRGSYQGEFNHDTDLIRCLIEKINQQDKKILLLEREDKLAMFDQINRKIELQVKQRTEVLQQSLNRERQLARSLEQALNVTKAAARNKDNQLIAKAIDDALTIVQSALVDISRDVHNIRQDLSAEARSQDSDHGMEVVRPREWLLAFMELHQRNIMAREAKKESSGCLVM